MQMIRQCYQRAQRGAMLPIAAFAIFATAGAAGLAVDTGRAQLVQSKLSAALDAAGLAAGANISTTNYTTEVDRYLKANYPAGYLGSVITSTTVTANSDNSLITLAATADVPTTFMHIFGQTKVTVNAKSEITRQSSGMELVLILDNTGSMSSSMTALKSSANTMLDILYGSKDKVSNLWVGLVPFAQAVNIGSARTSWLNSSHYATLNWGPTSWMGCVEDRETTGRDKTDDPPSTESFKAYYWPDHNSYNDWIRNNGTYITPLSTSRGPNKNCSQAVLPLTSSKATVKAAINTMQAVGNTHVNLGAVWGWRMLSPRWRGLWGGEMNSNNLPLDYSTKNMNKVAILMTDGDNTMSNSVRTAYGYLSDGRLGSTNATTAEAALDSKLSAVCTSMKNNNIIIYTIGFNNPGTTISNLLKNCATRTDYYFNSPSTYDLQQAFKAIGDSLANLRVSK